MFQLLYHYRSMHDLPCLHLISFHCRRLLWSRRRRDVSMLHCWQTVAVHQHYRDVHHRHRLRCWVNVVQHDHEAELWLPTMEMVSAMISRHRPHKQPVLEIDVLCPATGQIRLFFRTVTLRCHNKEEGAGKCLEYWRHSRGYCPNKMFSFNFTTQDDKLENSCNSVFQVVIMVSHPSYPKPKNLCYLDICLR